MPRFFGIFCLGGRGGSQWDFVGNTFLPSRHISLWVVKLIKLYFGRIKNQVYIPFTYKVFFIYGMYNWIIIQQLVMVPLILKNYSVRKAVRKHQQICTFSKTLPERKFLLQVFSEKKTNCGWLFTLFSWLRICIELKLSQVLIQKE